MSGKKTAKSGADRDNPSRRAREIETTVFRSGNSDAVRLPKHFAFGAGKRVRLRLVREGFATIERAQKRGWPKGFLESFGTVTADFAAPERPAASPESESRSARLFEPEL